MDLARVLSEAERERQAATARAEQVRANLAAVREVLSIGLTSDEAGELLREARRRAPEPADVARRVEKREREVAEARLDRVRLLEQRRLAETAAERAKLAAEVAEHEALLEALTDALAAERELAGQARELVRLLDERLLWIGSAPPVGPQFLADVAAGVRWVSHPVAWVNVGTTLVMRPGEVPVLSLLVTLTVAALIFTRLRQRRRIVELAARVGKYSTDGFRLTAEAAGVTLLLALPIPLALAGVGGLLATQSVDSFSQALGQGLLAAAAVGLLLDAFRLICRNGGLADAHFGWNPHARRTLLHNLTWLLPIEVAASVIVAGCDAGGEEVYRQGLGRLGFLVGSTALTIFVARVFRPANGVFKEMLVEGGWAWRLRKLWYAAVVLLPAALTLAAAGGYYFTATEVQGRFFTTGVLVLAGVVVYSMLTRWLRVARRRLAVKQAKQRLVEAREARLRRGEESTTDASGEATPELQPQTVDVDAASSQTLSLLRTLVGAAVLFGLWAIWQDVLPALAVLDRVELTSPTVDSEGAVIVDPVTLWSLLLAGLAAVLTVVAARNLPAVLELVVLQRFPLDTGTRYAAATLTRYIVVAIGIVVASQLIGIEWGRAQWIIAALGVGLGFGLQEIVANFVSGLIILFERPVRIGDTVTVGDVSGTVSRLQIRATTITDFDNKEILVPNKSFITERVVNWTLSNPITRLFLTVGVAYGSDPARVQALLLDAVKAQPAVLADPAPSVFFMGFGDSSLTFEVRVFVGELSKRLPTFHDLHSAINTALADAGIEIPFPQRDLHLRSSDVGKLADEAGIGR